MSFRTLGKLSGVIAATLLASTAVGLASSHREAPGISKTPKIDATDFYMFRSYEPGREDYVTFIANYQPLEDPYGGPNYFTMDEDAIYEIHIDNDGDAIEDKTFQFKFDNTLVNDTGVTLNVGGKDIPISLRVAGQVTGPTPAVQGETESYTLTLVDGDRRSGARTPITNASGGGTVFAKPLDNIGNKTIPDYAAYANQFMYNVDIPGCAGTGRVFVGQRADGFAVNLGEVFDLVNLTPIQNSAPNPTYPQYNDATNGNANGVVQDRANDDIVGRSNVTSLAIEVPIACLTGNGNGNIGAWTTASVPQASLQDPSPTYEQTALYGGAYVQKSRLSAPLVNELVIGLNSKDLFNSAEPTQDGALADFVTNPTLPAILDSLFGSGAGGGNIAPTNFPRNDLVAAFLTGFVGINSLKTVTPSEMMRLNTGVAPTALANQNVFGFVAGDFAGFPNGRRPIDDVVDIELRVAMGALCYPIPLPGQAQPQNAGYCTPADAPAGQVPFTDGAPLTTADSLNAFPYLKNPLPGSPDTAYNPR